jgi:hypothetical protein
LCPNIRFLPSTVTEKIATKNILDGRKDGQTENSIPPSPFGERGYNNYTSMDYGFPKEIPQGIITSTLELKSKENSYILSVDGKKLAPGLNENSGDQDLFGHETSQTDSLQF